MLLDKRTYQMACRAAELVGRALFAVSERLLVDQSLRRAIGVPDELGIQFQLDREVGKPPLFARLDAIPTENGGLSFLELNPFPGGIDETAEIHAAFEQMPIAAAFRNRFPFRSLDLRHISTEFLLDMPRSMGRRAPICFAHIRTGPNQTEGFRWLAHAAARGVICLDPTLEELELRGDDLYAAGERIDIVIMPPATVLMRSPAAAANLVAALQKGRVRAFSGISRGQLCGKKALLHVLTDPTYAAMFEPEVRVALARHVPWTRFLREGNTTGPDGTAVDLLPWVEQHREALVLKPVYGQQGDSVLLGYEATPEAWRAAMSKRDMVVQRRVVPVRQTFAVAAPGTQVGYVQAHHDIAPFLWDAGVSEGCVVRVSTEGIINFAQGGSVSVPWVLEDPP